MVSRLLRMQKALGSNPSGSNFAFCSESVRSLIIGHRMQLAVATAWPSGLRRQLKALVRKGVGSNPTAVKFAHIFWLLTVLCSG